MKFTDGYWQIREGMTAHYATQVEEIRAGDDSLEVFAATRPLTGRGDTLNHPLLTVRLTSPAPNVIGVELTHHKGQKPRLPRFELLPQPAPEVRVQDDAVSASITTGHLTARVAKAGPWRIDFLHGERPITSSGTKGMGYVDAPDGRFIHAELALGVGECVYGLGERFTPFVRNGQIVDLWNEDGGTSSEQAYKNVPFYLTNRGYGVFIDQPEKVSLEVGSEKVARVQFSVPGETLRFYLIYGPTPKEVLARYTALTGRPALPPAWSFGLWLSTSFTTDYDEATVGSFLAGMEERGIPLHVFHFDCFWMKQFQWVDFAWDERVFPDPAGMLRRLHDRGLKVCVWINPYVAQKSALFDEGMANGYLVERPNGDVWQWDRWQAGMGLVDFTNPRAKAWYCDRLRRLIDMGVDCFKTDFGERIPTDVRYHDGSDPVRMHNYYSYLYNQAVFQLLEEKHGLGNATVFARSATAGSQRFPVHWGGDSTATFESMAESLRGGLSLGLSGFGFWSHYIGGFEQTASAAVYKRWCAFGLLSSHSRLHGSSSYRVPWLFDDEAVEVLRAFTRLKCSLMPYLFQKAIEAHTAGTPVMRAMVLEFPDDPGCDTLDRQYMLGDQLLVAPVMKEDGSVDYYLPSGTWTSFLSGARVTGGRWVRERHGSLSLPLLARPDAVIPVGAVATRPDYDFTAGVTFHVFALADGARTVIRVPRLGGTEPMTLAVSRECGCILVRATAPGTGWRILLRGGDRVDSVKGGTAAREAAGTLITPAAGSDVIEIAVVPAQP
jgi:alpha-D-xyloside xylohydrolase